MAEVVLLAAILPKLITLLEDKVHLHQNMRKEILGIKSEMENIRAFLMTAEEANMEGNRLDEVWVKQLREIAFESVDVVDEFMLHFARDHLTGPCTCLASMFHSFKNWRAQHDIAFRKKDIRSRFQEVRDSNKRYHPDPASTSIVSTPTNKWYDPQQDALYNDNLVGIEERKWYLIDMLMARKNSTLEVISVHGMGGLGKTSLVKKVYDDEVVKETFQRKAWITVSRTFKPYMLFKNLIRQLHKEMMPPEFGELGNMRTLRMKQEVDNLQHTYLMTLTQKVRDILQTKRYMIVLDDIWSIDAWNAIRNAFPDSSYSSRLVITTRNEEIALAASNRRKDLVFEMKKLSWLHSLTLFCNLTFNSASCPDHLKEISVSILTKCGGVPLAIAAISGVLVRKDMTTSKDWKNVNRNLGAALDTTQRVLSLGYNDLPYHLKPCYLFSSIFPEDYLIQKRRLIRLWIAEGFVEREENMTQEEVAESYLTELVQRSLIQKASSAIDEIRETYCIHDLLREVIFNKATDQDFATIARENNRPWPEKVRRFSLHSNLSILQKKQSLQQLRSLFMFEVKQPLTKSSIPALFSVDFKFKLLTVLDLQGTILNNFPTTIFQLKNLRYLNLSHTDHEKVPRSIGRLQKLETSDLKNTQVTKLPKEILKLQRLRDLSAYRYKDDICAVHGFKAPVGVESLKSLHCLLSVDAGQNSGNMANKLGMLTQLRRLGITNFSNKNAKAICSSIDNLCALQVLSVFSSESENQAMDLQHLGFPSKSLQCLYLTGKLESLPPWMATLHNLVKLCLRSTNLQSDPLETLGQLPSLVQLELTEVCTCHKLQFGAGRFLKLKILGLHEFRHLDEVILQQGTMPLLERFRIASCKEMTMAPAGIEHLSKLTAFDLVNMPLEILTAINGFNKWEPIFFEKMKHIREINWVYREGDTWKVESLTTNTDINKWKTTNAQDFTERINDLEGK